MSSQHPVIAYDVAISHQDELLHRAETWRLADVAEVGHRSVLGGLKQAAGQTLVRLGERLQTTHHRRRGADLAAGAVRLSR